MTSHNLPLDLAEFRTLLLRASKNALQSMRSNLKGESLYSFALITTGLFGYVFPNGNTEECLQAAARKYLDDTGDFGNDLQMALKYCRWEPTAYWRFFRTNYDAFEEVNALLDRVSIEYALCQLEEHDFNEVRESLEQILFDVLRNMDHDGDFGSGRTRERFYVTISYQDQTYEDLHRCAKAVNPISVSDVVWNDLSEVLQYWQQQRAG